MTERESRQASDGADVIGARLAVERDTEGRYADEAAILEATHRVAEEVLGPHASQTDQGAGPRTANFRALAQAGLLGLTLPVEYGGLAASGDTQREYTEILASYCGVTTFTQAQHHGPSRMIASGPNPTLKQQLLPELATGQKLCAISFAHLRRPGPPILRAEPVAGGYQLNGVAPWVTGWGLMNQVVFGATLPDGRFVYVWSPADRADFPELFAEQEGRVAGQAGGTMVASPPIPLCAMNASATVELTLTDWFIPEAHCLAFSDRETMTQNDRNGVLNGAAMPLGCVAASVRLLCQTAERRGIPAIQRAATAFRAEWSDAKGQILEGSTRVGEPHFFENGVRLRAWCIELAVRAAHAAITASSGAANTLSHPAQRLLREAMFYTIQAQTMDVMDATLSRLER